MLDLSHKRQQSQRRSVHGDKRRQGFWPHGVFFKNEHFVYYVNGLCHKLYVGHGKDPKNLTFAPVMLDGKENSDSVDPDVVDLGNGKLRIFSFQTS